MSKESIKESNKKWKKENATRITFRLYKNTDADLIQFLETVGNKQKLIKDLLRQHIAKGK